MVRCRPLRRPIGVEFCVEFHPAPAQPVGTKEEDAQSHVLHDGLDSRQATTDASAASQHQTRTEGHVYDNQPFNY